MRTLNHDDDGHHGGHHSDDGGSSGGEEEHDHHHEEQEHIKVFFFFGCCHWQLALGLSCSQLRNLWIAIPVSVRGMAWFEFDVLLRFNVIAKFLEICSNF